MEMNEAWHDIYDEGYTNQFQPGRTKKIQKQHQSTLLKDIINGLSLTVIDYNHINPHECQRTEIKRKEKDCENHRQESEQES